MRVEMTQRSWRSVLPGLVALAGGSLGIWALGAGVNPRAASAEAPTDSTASSTVVELRIDDEIEPILADYVVKGIAQANADHAALVLITLNTPGGLDVSMREMIHAILTSSVPVVTFVAPTGSRAASAGFFILLSADVAAMSPGTDTGAASPVMFFGGSAVPIDETLHRKIVNEASAYLRSFVSKRGRNVDLAVTAVTDAKAFSETEALDGKLVDLLAASKDDLLSKLDGRTIKRFDESTMKLALPHPVLAPFTMNARERFLARIVQPDILFILLIVGVLGLYAEFTHPGLFAPGVIGGIALVLALYAMHLLPVNLAGLALIVLSLALFVLEAKFPTHGILGLGGAVSMFLGALFLIRSPWTGRGVSPSIALAVTIPFALITIFLMRLVLRSRNWKPSTGKEELIGEEGEITTPVDPTGRVGMVLIHGELWRAAAAGQSIPKGARVRVRRITGLTLEVEPVGANSQQASQVPST
jgi:membrane-bound serine protease (ClpP class)